MLMMLPPAESNCFTAACEAKMRPSTFRLNCLWKCSSVMLSVSAVGQTDPLGVEMDGFKLTRLESGRRAANSSETRRMCGLYGEQTQGARATSNIEFNEAGLGDSQDRPAIGLKSQYRSQLRAD